MDGMVPTPRWSTTRFKSMSWRRVLLPSPGYLHLLFSTGATKIDYLLITVGFISACGQGVPFPLLGILFGQLVDDLGSASCSATSADQSNANFAASINQKVLYLIYITIANFVLLYLHSFCWSLIGERLVRRLRTLYLSSLLRQDLSYFDALPAGEVASRLDASISSIQTGTSEKVGLCISSISYFVVAYIIAFNKSAKLAGMLFSIVPAFLLMAFVGGHFAGRYTKKMSDAAAKATAVASGGLTNMIIVKAFSANDKLEAVFAQHMSVARREGLKKAIVSSIQMGTLYFIAYSANALAFWQGSREIAASVADSGAGTSVGNVYAVIFILVDASFIISQVAPFLQLFATAVASYSDLKDTIERHSSIDGTETGSGLVLDSVQGRIEFEGVGFVYASRPDATVLKNFSLDIPARKHTAIVGLSGSGKSTIAAMTARLYDPIEGRVLLDGHDMKDLNPRAMRRWIGSVEQNGALFDRSILENIAHGLINSPEHDELQTVLLGSTLGDMTAAVRAGKKIEDALAESSVEVREVYRLAAGAAELAHSSRFIGRLPDGLCTSVGSAGSQLSGGQKQRIVLARAIIRQPAILILDEATASLDSSSERLIQDALKNFSKGRTTITIAHRLSTVKHADNVVVMRAGEILEQGTYEDLLAAGGALAAMIRLQDVGSESAPGSRRGSLISRASTIAPEDAVTTSDSTGSLVKPPASRTEKAPVLDDGSDGMKPKKQKKQDGAAKSLMGVFAMSRPYLGWVMLGLAGAAVVGGSHSGEAVIFGYTIGGLSPCNGVEGILSSGRLFGLLFFVLAIVVFSANVISTSSFGKVAESMLYRIRILCLRSLFYQDIAWHESEDRSPSSLLSYISNDANALSGLTGTIFGVIFSILLNMVSGIVLAHIIAWKIAIVLLATVPVLLLSGFLRLRVLAQFHERHQKAFAHSVGIATEAISSMKTIATFSLEQETLSTYIRSLYAPYRATLKNILIGNFWLALAFSISNLVYALAYWWGSKQIIDGNYTQTQFFIVLPALLFSAQSCGQMFSLAPDVSKASVAANRVLELIRAGPDNQSTSKAEEKIVDLESGKSSEKRILTALPSSQPPKESGLGITFNDVTFSYPSRPAHQILNGLTLDLRPGTFNALVGPSGAGKSTIISLLLRFYHPTSGHIGLGSNDLSALPPSFRDTIALVPQTSSLFAGTIKFNLLIGASPSQPAPSQADLELACRRAGIHALIKSLPNGYDTTCSGGSLASFSGGQIQRLAIARALVRKPRLLLLDESTSALDAESEAAVQDALRGVVTGGETTVVAIAHRLRTIREAERIWVVEGGKCVDVGRHEELVGRCETYRKNVALQTLE